jgi:hypothetical protein
MTGRSSTTLILYGVAAPRWLRFDPARGSVRSAEWAALVIDKKTIKICHGAFEAP